MPIKIQKSKKGIQTTDNEEGFNDKPIPPKKSFTIKKDLQNIDPKVADCFALYIKSLDRNTHINPLVKRITYKDGKTRIGVIYEFVQLWNEFVPLYPILLEQLKKGI
jgi:hypothetical protein